MINPVAVFDVLHIGLSLERKLDDFSQYEIQLFGYLSCLLHLYEGNPISSWGYDFVKNDFGSPYSRDINLAVDALKRKGLLVERQDTFLTISSDGKAEYEVYSGMHSNKARLTYLTAACNSIKLMPYGLVKSSISQEPMLMSANGHNQDRFLTDEANPAYALLYEQFEMLKIALRNHRAGLTVPAVVWLEYLNLHRHPEELSTSEYNNP